MESSVRDIQGPQQVTWRVELAAMVDQQLERFQTRLHTQIQDWTEEAMKACEDLEAKVEHMQTQLQEVGHLQKGLGYAQDAICQRLEAVETSGLRPILEEQVESPGGRTADSARSVPQSSTPRTFAEAQEQWEKRGESSSHTQTVLKSFVYSQSEVQDPVG